MRITVLALLIACNSTVVFAQSPDPGVSVTPLPSTANQDEPALDRGAPIYNGREHRNYDPAIKGHAYHRSDEWLRGTLVYRGVPYTGVFLKYDLVEDEVVVRHFNGFTGVVLFSPRIASFTLGSETFVYVDHPRVPAGIYQELRHGTVTLYARRSKTIRETVVATGVQREFEARDQFFASKNGVFYPVKSQNDLMDLLKDKRTEIGAMLKDAGLKFRNEPEATLIRMVEFYNQTTR